LGQHLSDKHGEKAGAIMEKFSNLDRDHVVVRARIAETDIDGFFMIPGLTGWHKSNLKSFIQINELNSDIDTDVQADLDTWIGCKVIGVLEKTQNGTFLRLAK